MTDQLTSALVDRWRALRGSPSGPPVEEGFAVLLSAPNEQVPVLAAATGDEIERVHWWKSIADDPARNQIADLRLSQVPVYVALRDSGPLTDDELVTHLGRKKSEIGPRRIELVRLGLIREVEKRPTAAGRKSAAWGAVPPEEMEEARGKARQKGPRRKHLDKYSLEEKIQIVRYLISKDDVNEALLQDQSRSMAKDRARREARAVHAEGDRARREFNERVRQAERDASPQLVFLKAVAQVRRAGDAVREIDRVIEESNDSQLLFGSPDVGLEHWPEVRAELRNLIQTAVSAETQLDFLLKEDEEFLDFEDSEEAEVIEIEGPSF